LPTYSESRQKPDAIRHANAKGGRLKLSAKVNNMNTKLMMSAVAAAALIGVTGCSSNPTNAQIGTGVGAVAGGLVGNAVFGSTLGTVGGAAAGALIGNEVGKKR